MLCCLDWIQKLKIKFTINYQQTLSMNTVHTNKFKLSISVKKKINFIFLNKYSNNYTAETV
jgi:hypothetical protein